MSGDTSRCSLFLAPMLPDFGIEDAALLVSQLRDIGLIAKDIPDLTDSYHTGNRYLDYVAYMGCSPSIKFDGDQNNGNFCHVKIHQHGKARLIVSQLQTRAPHCPNCNKPVKDWFNNKTDNTIRCHHCKQTSDIGKFNWKKMAGYARTFIEITDIFPKEAVPQQSLLDELHKINKTDWLYFYSCQ